MPPRKRQPLNATQRRQGVLRPPEKKEPDSMFDGPAYHLISLIVKVLFLYWVCKYVIAWCDQNLDGLVDTLTNQEKGGDGARGTGSSDKAN